MADTLESRSVGAQANDPTSARNSIRVLSVIPESATAGSFPRIQRQVDALRGVGILGETFMLRSRSPRFLVGEWKRLRRAIKAFRPDFVHAQYGTVTAFLTVLSTSLPVVITFRGSDLNPYNSRSHLRQRVARVLSQFSALKAAQIICVSTQLRERLWWRRDRVTVIPTGLDTAIFRPRPQEEARWDLGWGPEDRVVLFNAGADPVSKRLDLALAAVEVAREKCGNIRLVVLDGRTCPAVIPTVMSASDCLLLTSDWEGSPNVVKEAIACCLPVVTVDAGDVRERLAGVRPSRIVARDPREIGKGIAEILELGGRSDGQNAVNELTIQAISKRLATTYETAMGKK